MTSNPRIAVLVTCFNRRELTLRALRTLLHEQEPHDAELHVHLVDDGSSDGTGDAVAAAHPDQVTVLRGDGSLFWNGGMRRAWLHARATRPDAYLWFNDDVALRPDAMATTLAWWRRLADRGITDPVLVGSTDDPETGELTYGGVMRPAPVLRPLAFEMVQPTPSPVAVETFNGQWVLVPAAVAEDVGNLDHRYTHGMGDYDYGLRALRKGHEAWVLPGFVGSCPRNPVKPVGERPLSEELRQLADVRELPMADWQVFSRRWGGPAWPVYWASPYVRRSAALLRARRS